MAKSNFKKDVEQERILTEIIDDIVFKGYVNKLFDSTTKTFSFEDGTAEKEKQFEGIDLEWDVKLTNGTIDKRNVDVKAQTNKYINHPTKTFCMELSYLKNGILKDGWFVQDKMKTDYFLFVWIHNATLNEEEMIVDKKQIKKMEFMLVQKNKIKEYLEEHGFDKTGLINISKRMRKDKIDKLEENGIRFTCSNFLGEKPVNVIIWKDTYKKMPKTKHFMYENGRYMIL